MPLKLSFQSFIGKTITFTVPNGIGRHGVEYKRKAGRVVFGFDSHCVVNGGGRHGTPHVVDENNFVCVGNRVSRF